MKINVSCVQLWPKLGDKQYNLDKMKTRIEEVMEKEPKTNLIVFPELMTSGYEGTPEMFQQLAETAPEGESMVLMAQLAKKYHVHIVYGFPERDPVLTDVLYNSMVLIDCDGKVLGTYRKMHPFADEKRWCRAGCETPIYDTEIGKIGMMICWDTGFPEVARCYALKGADLIVVSTNWEDPYADDWDLITKARAFDNTLHLVAANRIGDDGGTLSFFGHSKIMSPVGKEIAALDKAEEGIISAEIDLSLTQKERARYYTFFKDRRPDAYGEIVKPY